jgi:hypothetical protein
VKKIVVVIVAVVAGLIAFNYVSTGEFSLIPSFTLSEDERELKALEDRFKAATKQYSQAGRTAAVSGIDTTSDVEAARRSVRQISKELKALRKGLSSESSIRKAEELAASVRSFSESLQ